MKPETLNTHSKGFLRSRKLIELLFVSGKGVTSFPFRIQYYLLPSVDELKMEVLFTVPKKMFKKAVKRNVIRRRAKEAFRLNKHLFCGQIPENYKLLLAFIYIDKTVHPYDIIRKSVIAGLEKIIKISINENRP